MKNIPDNQTVVSVNHITKSFRIPLDGSMNIKQKIVNVFKGSKGYRVFTPLNDISFDIKEGEFYGIVGRNGSGKSTLLKTMANIYTPEKGSVKVKGLLVPFIELGVGFNPDLTGRENVYLNGALLGFDRYEITAMYEEIVDFAELHDFMEECLKNYSSGMQVRLAFSIAIRARGDILLLDEVLAVGDEAFQRKCYDYFNDLRRNKKTVVLVTHNMGAVETFCTKALFLEDGEIKLVGDPHEVASAYSKSNDKSISLQESLSDNEYEKNRNQNININIVDKNGKTTSKFTAGDTMTVEVSWTNSDVKNIGVAIFKSNGDYVYGTNTYIEKIELSKNKKMSYEVDLNVAEGSYFLKAALFGENDAIRIEFEEHGTGFVVNREKNDYRWGGITKLTSRWRQ